MIIVISSFLSSSFIFFPNYFKFTDLDACSEYGYCSSDVPDDEMDFFKLDDLTAYSSPALFSDPGELDFGFDSGIEAEMDEPNDLPQFHCHYLWEFLHHILLDKENKYIEWKNKTRGVFRLKDHNGLARLWGKQKNRKNMTYEKLSRALRYYYSKDILQKVPGQRLTYKFVHNLDGKKYPL
ncbi:PREDICTED: ETS homologous factor-like [Acropora digitifera]|uniref:ETS homologous factor-like n=1 Tax=Acropora digitifera TaxID=70779 RepID=UPI000779F9EC|nr:PREDICTED: ETS homologous factor-like [Acropora digitifera]